MGLVLKIVAIAMFFTGAMTALVGYFFFDADAFPSFMYVLIPVQLIIAVGLFWFAQKSGGNSNA